MYKWRLAGDVTLRRQPYVDLAFPRVEMEVQIGAVLSGTAFLAPLGYSPPITCCSSNEFLAGFGISAGMVVLAF